MNLKYLKIVGLTFFSTAFSVSSAFGWTANCQLDGNEKLTYKIDVDDDYQNATAYSPERQETILLECNGKKQADDDGDTLWCTNGVRPLFSEGSISFLKDYDTNYMRFEIITSKASYEAFNVELYNCH